MRAAAWLGLNSSVMSVAIVAFAAGARKGSGA